MAEKGRTKFEEKRKTLESILEGKSAFKGGSWGTDILKRTELHEYDGKSVIFKYTVHKDDCNLAGTLHGGAIATLADILTTYASLIEDLHLRPGVSISLDVEFLRAPKPSELIFIQCTTDKTGAFLSFSSAVFVSSKDELIAKAKHIKFLGAPPAKL